MNEKEIYKLLSDLRSSKQKGELDTEENLAQQTLKWRNTLEYGVFETCVRHHSEEVTQFTVNSNLILEIIILYFSITQCRLEILALLVESRKSTLRFTRMELEMILSFLKYNLCEKMEYVPFVKKVKNLSHYMILF